MDIFMQVHTGVFSAGIGKTAILYQTKMTRILHTRNLIYDTTVVYQVTFFSSFSCVDCLLLSAPLKMDQTL